MGNKIHQIEKYLFAFRCPGCQSNHAFDSRWTFNGDFQKPTFNPSLLVEIGKHPNPPDRCHSFVKEGKIQFLNDCSHDMAGQTVDIPDWEE